MASSIVPVILAGGTGSRLWPQSRSLWPKRLSYP
ncbi:sugar phosphate nucleotidyltransferase [Sansalvadorimonas verongulae]|nr:sugar phosphate nucleotidyltransferase [Sansalvadorimonas verongulae]